MGLFASLGYWFSLGQGETAKDTPTPGLFPIEGRSPGPS